MFLVPQDVGVRVWLIYTLYTLHECQVTRRKRKIVFPQCRQKKKAQRRC